MAGFKKHTLSFDIYDTTNSKTLVLIDTSDYYEQPERPLLEITMPGYSKYFLANIIASKVNTLNSNIIGLSAFVAGDDLCTLPDGVWTFKLKICPYDKIFKIKYHLRTVELENKLDRIYKALDFSDCDVSEDAKLKNSIIDIILSIESGKAHARCGDVKKAHDLYNIGSTLADKILNKISKQCV